MDFKTLFRSVMQRAGVVANEVSRTGAIPRCQYCDNLSLTLSCICCGEAPCYEHGWFSPGTGECLCAGCLEELLDLADAEDTEDTEDEPPRRPRTRTMPRQKRKAQKRPEAPSADDWPWKVLKVPPTASAAEVKAAYRKLAKASHPDHGGDERVFKALTEAYQEALRLAQEQKNGRRDKRGD